MRTNGIFVHFQRISIYLEAVHGNLCPERLGQNQNVTDITLVRSKKYSKCSYFLGPSMLALLIVPKFCVLSFYLDSYRHLRGFFQPFIDVKLIFPKICPKIGYWKVNSGSPSKNLHDVFVWGTNGGGHPADHAPGVEHRLPASHAGSRPAGHVMVALDKYGKAN